MVGSSFPAQRLSATDSSNMPLSDGAAPPVEIVTVTYNSGSHLPAYFEALRSLDYPRERLKLVIIDNGSQDETIHVIGNLIPGLPFPAEIVELPNNEGFGAACNHGVNMGSAPFVLLLNPDTCLAPEALRWLTMRAVSEPTIGLIDGAQEPVDVLKWHDPDTADTDWCSGAAVLVRREAFAQVGGFDTFFFLYAEDVDLSWRMWLAGWRCVYERRARVQHNSSLADGSTKPVEIIYSVRNSFAMRVIYDSPGGVGRHLITGLRYLVSPRTEPMMRRAVAAGLWASIRRSPYLLRRRRAAQMALATSGERQHIVFTEWFYGRFIN